MLQIRSYSSHNIILFQMDDLRENVIAARDAALNNNYDTALIYYQVCIGFKYKTAGLSSQYNV